MRIGHSYDIHRLVSGRPLILGGVQIPHETGLLGHSDADCLLHAIADALLGAAGLSDIGQQFPDTDPAYQGADSQVLLQKVHALITQKGYCVVNIDATLVAQAPKLAPYLFAMRQNIARCLHILVEAINVKVRTHEGLDAIGNKEAIAAWAVCLIDQREPVQ